MATLSSGPRNPSPIRQGGVEQLGINKARRAHQIGLRFRRQNRQPLPQRPRPDVRLVERNPIGVGEGLKPIKPKVSVWPVRYAVMSDHESSPRFQPTPNFHQHGDTLFGRHEVQNQQT